LNISDENVKFVIIRLVHRFHSLAFRSILMIFGHINCFQQLINIWLILLQRRIDLRTNFLHPLNNHWHGKNVVTVWSAVGIDLQHNLNEMMQIFRIVLADLRINTFVDLLKQALHVFCLKRWVESYELINDTAQRPDVRFKVVRFVTPHFWRGVVRCSCLSVVESLLVGDLAHIHVTKFNCIVLVNKHICWLQISMHNI